MKTRARKKTVSADGDKLNKHSPLQVNCTGKAMETIRVLDRATHARLSEETRTKGCDAVARRIGISAMTLMRALSWMTLSTLVVRAIEEQFPAQTGSKKRVSA